MIKRYVKKPIQIEAVELTWGNWNTVCDFVSKEISKKGVYLDDSTLKILPEDRTSNTLGLLIKTPEGDMLARQGDYIIKGVNGEFYPCKPDVFKKTYQEE